MGTEVDVFISNYTLVDPEIYQLWVEGHAAAEAVAVLNQRGLGQITGASLELIASDVLDHYRTYSLLEKLLSNPNKLQEQLALQIDSLTRQLLIETYYEFDDVVIRELIGKKLTGKHRKDLDDISEKTGIAIKSCRRQFDNVKRICKVVEEMPGSILDNIQNSFYLSENLARKYACVVFLGSGRFETSKKKLNHVSFSMWKRCTAVFMEEWTNGNVLNLEELENKLFMEIKDAVKILGDKEKDHKHLASLLLKSCLLQKNYQDFDLNFKVYSKAILTLASSLHRPREMRTIFVDLHNLAESFKQAGWTSQDVGMFFNGYKQSAFEIDSLRDAADMKPLWEKFMKVVKDCLLILY